MLNKQTINNYGVDTMTYPSFNNEPNAPKPAPIMDAPVIDSPAHIFLNTLCVEGGIGTIRLPDPLIPILAQAIDKWNDGEIYDLHDNEWIKDPEQEDTEEWEFIRHDHRIWTVKHTPTGEHLTKDDNPWKVAKKLQDQLNGLDIAAGDTDDGTSEPI